MKAQELIEALQAAVEERGDDWVVSEGCDGCWGDVARHRALEKLARRHSQEFKMLVEQERKKL